MASSFVEPWVPEVGQTVRVLSRPECFYCRQDGEAEVGFVGVVERINAPALEADDPEASAHRFWVKFPEDAMPNDCPVSHFAAVELEPVGGSHAVADS